MRFFIITCAAFFVILLPKAGHTQSFLADYKLKWTNAMEYTLEFAQAMPEDHYGYKPVPAEMSFREQLKHIAANMVWLSSSYLKGKHTIIDPTKAGDSKKEIIEMLTQSFNYAKEKFDVGLMNSFDLNQSQTLLSNAQSDVLRTKYDYIFKIKILEFYFGIPIIKN